MTDTPACRLAVVASHPIQYFTPLYRRLAKFPGLDLDVLFCRDFGVRPRFDRQFAQVIAWDTDQLSGYNHRFLKNISPVHDTFNPLHAINPGAFLRLLSGYDALWVNGYLYPSNWLAVFAARLRRTRILLRSELQFGSSADEPSARPLRDAVLRQWIQRSDALLYIGRANRQAYLHYGAREEQLFFAPYSVDVERIAALAPEDGSARVTARNRWNVPTDRPVALFVGKLTRNKHPEALLQLARVAAARPIDVHLVFVGSGEMQGELEEAVKRDGLTNVSMLGFVNQSELPRVYAMADLFILPSDSEPWGLVVNEAMAAGIPVVVSDSVGCAPDLIQSGVTGYTFPRGDWNAMAHRALTILEDPMSARRMGRAARELSSRYSYDATVAGILAALSALGLFTAGEQVERQHVEA